MCNEYISLAELTNFTYFKIITYNTELNGFCTHIYVNIALCNLTHFTIFFLPQQYMFNQYLIEMKRGGETTVMSEMRMPTP